MDPQARLVELKGLIKPLASIKSLTDEQFSNLKELMDEHERLEMQVKAAALTADEPDELDKRIDAKLAKLAAEPPTNRPGIAVPAIKKVTERGDDNDGMKGFRHWMRTGDDSAMDPSLKASNVGPLEEGNNGEGAYLVPPDFYPQIVAKRDEMSIARAAGARVINTDLKLINIPTESTKAADFVITAEEGAVDEDEPIFGQVAVTVYRRTKLTKVSVELLADQKADLDSYLVDTVGRALARTENNVFLVGSGSSDTQGAVVGGTQGVSLAATSAFAAGEIVDLKHKLPVGYQDGAVYVSTLTSLGKIRQLGTTTFRWYEQTPNGQSAPYKGTFGSLEGSPAFVSGYMAELGSGNKPLLYGNFNFYAVVERQQLAVQRLVELYAGNGQVGLLWSTRFGGAVLQAEAFQYAKCNTT